MLVSKGKAILPPPPLSLLHRAPSPFALPRFLLLLRRSPSSSSAAYVNCKSRMSTQANATTAPTPQFNFIPIQHNHHNATQHSPPGPGFQFRLVSYNILAQVYVKSTYFPHSPSSCLKWKARSKAVLEELKSFNADFLCVQELDEYNTFYRKNMENLGYSSIYIQRTGEKRDGCGIFYKPGNAELVLREEIHYNDLTDIHGLSDNVNSAPLGNSTSRDASTKESCAKTNIFKRGDPNDPCVRFKRNCVGLLAAFKLNNPSNHLIVVANTHIYWDPEWVDVKLAQAKYLLCRLSKFKEFVSSKFNCRPSVIVAGDFNSTPGDTVYNYLLSSNSESGEEAQIKLQSLYAANGGEPEFTNCTPGFTGTLDYIFLSDCSILKPVSLLCVPGRDSEDVQGGLPNHHHPSDHLPIGGDFQVLSS